MKKIKPLGILIALHLAMVVIAVLLIARHKGNPVESSKEKIVVIPISGIITMENRYLAAGQSVDSFVHTLQEYEDQPDVKALVLRINSPGGSIGAVQEIYQALKKLRAKGKVIVSSFADVSASGGYYIACAGDKIVSNPGTITGSIGVLMQTTNVTGLLQKIGVSFETIKSGDFKDSGSPFRKMTAQERSYLQNLILDAYDQFFTAVKEGRNLTDKELIPLADGRIFSGRMAQKNKLVDELGGLQEAIDLARKLTNLTEKKPEIVYEKDKRSLDRFLKLLGKSPVQQFADLAMSETKIMYLMK